MNGGPAFAIEDVMATILTTRIGVKVAGQ